MAKVAKCCFLLQHGLLALQPPAHPVVRCVVHRNHVAVWRFPAGQGENLDDQAAEHGGHRVRGFPVRLACFLPGNIVTHGACHVVSGCATLQLLLHGEKEPVGDPTQVRLHEVRPSGPAARTVHGAADQARKVMRCSRGRLCRGPTRRCGVVCLLRTLLAHRLLYSCSCFCSCVCVCVCARARACSPELHVHHPHNPLQQLCFAWLACIFVSAGNPLSTSGRSWAPVSWAASGF